MWPNQENQRKCITFPKSCEDLWDWNSFVLMSASVEAVLLLDSENYSFQLCFRALDMQKLKKNNVGIIEERRKKDWERRKWDKEMKWISQKRKSTWPKVKPHRKEEEGRRAGKGNSRYPVPAEKNFQIWAEVIYIKKLQTKTICFISC